MALPPPVGRQREVLYFRDSGHIVVLGTAGSGKTTLAIHRANYLANIAPNRGRTMLVTFNRTLVTYLKAIAGGTVNDVDVRNYHDFARGYLSGRGALGPNDIVSDPEVRRSLIRSAIAETLAVEPGSRILSRHPLLIADEFEWIARVGIRDEAMYLAARRVHRGSFRVTNAERPALWRAYQAYLSVRQRSGYKFDWDDIAVAVQDELLRDGSRRRYRHIVVDEGQDLSPVMLRTLASAVPPDGTITFFGDVAQQIYGSRVSWRDAGLQVDASRIVHFEENYRNTQEIAAFALSLAQSPFFSGTPDMVAPRAPTAAGPLPAIVRCTGADVERRFVISRAAALGRTRSVAVLLPDRGVREAEYIAAIQGEGIQVTRLHRRMAAWAPRPGVWVGTYYAAKGLEFDAVIVPHLDDDKMPDAEQVRLIGDANEVCRDEAKLLYVAITRARSDLILTHSGLRSRILNSIDPGTYSARRYGN